MGQTWDRFEGESGSPFLAGITAAPVVAQKPRLRDYQSTAISQVLHYYMTGNDGHPLIAMPTGTGKSLVIAYFIKTILEGWADPHVNPSPGCTFLVLTHSKELVKNDYEQFERVMPEMEAGIYCADLGRKEAGRQVTFASIQSVARKVEAFTSRAAPIRCVIIDEAHRVSPKEGTSYQKVIAALKAANPGMTVLGLSATCWRLKDGSLVEQGGVFTDMAVDMSSGEAFLWFIRNGYLVRLAPRHTATELDTSDIRVDRASGDFDESQVIAAMDAQGVIPRALAESIRLAEGFRRWLIFAPSIRHCEEIVEWITRNTPMTATCVHSQLPDKERDKRLADHKAGRVKVMVNCNILTTGYDDPAVDCIIVLRPTVSSGLWVQMLGRGTRPLFPPNFNQDRLEDRLAAIAQNKPFTLVLDFAGNTERLGPINYPVIPEVKRGKVKNDPDRPNTKLCPNCLMKNPVAVKFCEHCGHEFTVARKEPGTRAATDELVVEREPTKVEKDIRTYPVQRMTATPYTSQAGKKSILVTYFTTGGRFKTYLNWETPKARYPLEKWWKAHCPGYGLPSHMEAALTVSAAFRKPDRVQVWLNKPGPYTTEVISYEFDPALAA